MGAEDFKILIELVQKYGMRRVLSMLGIIGDNYKKWGLIMAEYIEKWLPVVGYEGLYEVSNMGNVRKIDGKIIFKWVSKRDWDDSWKE